MKFVERAVVFVFLLMLASSWILGVGQAFDHAPAAAGTEVCVHPDEMVVKVGDVFEVYVNVCDVFWLQGFDFMLTYDTCVLDCLGLEEGTFMSSFGDTFIAMNEVNDKFSSECGRVWLAIAILGEGYADGSGTLAVIRFNATAVGESVLNLFSDYPHKPDEVKLTTCGSQAIPNIAIDGHVVAEHCSNGCDRPDPPDPPAKSVDPPNPDINNDGFVNILDLAMIAGAYGASAGADLYDAKVDLDENGSVDICDVAICALVFGQNV